AKRRVRTPGRPSSASTSRPESSARVGNRECAAYQRAFSQAFCSKVAPTSGGGSSRPTSRGESRSVLGRSSRAPNSDSLWAELVATSNRRRFKSTSVVASAQHLALHGEKLAQPVVGRGQQAIHAGSVERLAFGRALDLHVCAVRRTHDVEVNLGARILRV